MRMNGGADWQAQVMGQVGSQPAAGGWIGLSGDTTAPAATDTTLTGEYSTLGLSRAAATYAHTTGTNVYTLSNTWTASGNATVNKEAVFNAVSSGTMIFESLEPATAQVVNGDTYSNVISITY